MDNCATRKIDLVKRWLAAHPRFTFHVTPKSSSWFNLVERLFSTLITKRLNLAFHKSVAAPKESIKAVLDAVSSNPRPFVWAKRAEDSFGPFATLKTHIPKPGHLVLVLCCGVVLRCGAPPTTEPSNSMPTSVTIATPATFAPTEVTSQPTPSLQPTGSAVPLATRTATATLFPTGAVPTPSPSATSTTLPTQTIPGKPSWDRIEHPSGFSLEYPDTWQTAKLVISTEFSQGADCVSVKIVDREAPSGSGQAPFLYQSVFQVCARAIDGRSLAVFMEATYGVNKGGFAPVEVGGQSGYRIDQGQGATIFLQSDRHRFQVITSAVAEAPLQALRFEQVRMILDSFIVRSR